MVIKPKYKRGDKVICNDRYVGIITSRRIHIEQTDTTSITILYMVDDYYSFLEKNIIKKVNIKELTKND